METRKIPVVDRLRDRGFIDQWGFIAFATTGFVGIVSAKWAGAETVWVAVAAIVLMLLYAVVVGRSGTGRVRADQAGDNCYYLGLIYTLASLSYAIATFDPNDTASTIVQGFGVALATTIFGLILRVFFNQGRPDLENVEEQARLELTHASTRLKGELGEVVRNMNDFSRQLQQSITELHREATASIEECAKASTESLQGVAALASEAIRDEANDFAARSRRYSSSFSKLLACLEDHSESLASLTSAHNLLRETAELAQGTATSAETSLRGLSEVSREASAAVSHVKEASDTAGQSAERMAAVLSQIEQTVQSVRTETEAQLTSLRSGPGQVATSSIDTLAGMTSRLSAAPEQVSTTYQSLIEGLKQQAEMALTTARQHNQELELELGKSRSAAVRVHGSLVEITDQLARRVEERA